MADPTAPTNQQIGASDPNANYNPFTKQFSLPGKAPSAPSPTAPNNPAQPTTVVNSGTAANYTNNTLVPALQTAQQGLTDQNAKNTSNTFGLGDGSQYDVNGNQIKGPQTQGNGQGQGQPGQPTQTPTPPEQTPGTAEHQLLNTPNPGYHYEYAPDGTRTEVLNGMNQQGFSMTPPPTPVTGVSGVTQPNGTTIKQMSDGSYASYDAQGNYQGPAGQQQYQDAQTANELSQNIAKIANGTYPLSQTEQAQVTALQQAFEGLIKQQQIANANFTGGTTVAMNLYGMGTSIAGMGEIKGTVDSGLAKIADLNSKMVQAVADMEQSFKEKDMAMMKAAYDVLTSSQKDRQAAIDKLKADTEAKTKDIRDYTLQLQTQMDNEQKQKFDEVMANANFDETQKKNQFEQYIQTLDQALKNNQFGLEQQKFLEQQKQNAIDSYYKGVTASQEAQKINIQQQEMELKWQELKDSQDASSQAVVNATVQSATGQKYIDGSQLDAKGLKAALAAGQIVLKGKDADAMNGINNIAGQFSSLLNTLKQGGVLDDQYKITPSGIAGTMNKGGTRGGVIGFLTNNWYVAGDQEQAVRDFNTNLFGTKSKNGSIDSSSLLGKLQALPDTGDMVATIQKNAFKDSDTPKEFQAKLNNIQDALQNTTTTLLSRNLPQNGYTATTPDGKTYNFPDQQSLDKFKQDAGLSNEGSGSTNAQSSIINKVQAIPNGKDGGECGHFVNRLTGLGLGDSYKSKLAKMDTSIKEPEPGMVFVMPYKDTGHTGIILSVDNGIATVKDSNYKLNGKVETHKLPVSKMTGFAYA